MAGQPETINQLFRAAIRKQASKEFLRWKSGPDWQCYSYTEVYSRVRDLALGLHSLGIHSGDRVAIWSENRPDWNVADLAVLGIGAADVPIYTTQAPAQVGYILANSEARALFVSASLLENALAVAETLPHLEWIISFDGPYQDAASATKGGWKGRPTALPGGKGKMLILDDLLKTGHDATKANESLFEDLAAQVAADDLASLIYTSGTTGEPKGVMLSHRNLVANTLLSCDWLRLNGREDLALSYLPLSHIFERGVWYVYLNSGATVAYAQSIDTVAQDLLDVRPTAMTSVPRMFEKIYARMLEKGGASPFPRRQIFSWALAVAREWARAKDGGRSPGVWLKLTHRIADVLVYKKLRESMGGRIRILISGGAALAPEIALVFSGAGFTILQGYGLTETSPSISCNTESANRTGSVGKVIQGVQLRIADDGEILVKGDTITRGYFKRPKENEESFTADGWFCTGDIGYLDPDGFLFITDRKKDLIKTSGGKYVAPQLLESLIKSSPFVSQVVVVGNGRKFASALIVPNIELLKSYAERKEIKYGSEEELIADSRIRNLIERQVNKHTAELARYEQIKKVAVLQHELTIESGELTPTLKPRRTFIEEKYAAVIDSMYRESVAEGAAVVGGTSPRQIV